MQEATEVKNLSLTLTDLQDTLRKIKNSKILDEDDLPDELDEHATNKFK